MHNKKQMLLNMIGQLKKSFKFNPALATFTPSMAKRNSAAPFAAGVMVQGSRDTSALMTDTIFMLRGSSIKNGFSPVNDAYQGSIVFWITPEWNGNDNLNHQIYGTYASSSPYVLKTLTNVLYLYVHQAIVSVVDVSSWVAGNTYCVIGRWDSKNSLDGTNRGCLSINDVHSFSGTLSFDPVGSLTTNIYVVSQIYSTGAIIEGLTVYRRVLFDGTYGTDIGNGDELALIYNAGTGKDPTEITGSWDVVFCLPTNATAGALVTGTGEAWSHPHSSNVLKDGWLADGYYGGGDYSVESVVGTKIVAGADAGLNNLADNAFTVEGWIRLDVAALNYIFSKRNTSANVGWAVYHYLGEVAVRVECADTSPTVSTTLPVDGKWHHIAFTFDDAGDRKVRLFLDGILKTTSTAGVGAVVDDSAFQVTISETQSLQGGIGWFRVSDSIRYTTDFVPPNTPPASDANTLVQWNMSEGTGTTVADETANANDGTITDGTWTPVWKPSGSPIVPQSVAFNGTSTYIDAGSEASIDDLADGAMTFEGWVNPTSTPDYRQIIQKGSSSGFIVQFFGGYFNTAVYCSTTNAGSAVLIPENLIGKWFHISVTFDDAGDRKIRIFINGSQLSYVIQTAGVGAVISDAASNLILGGAAGGTYFPGLMGWTRISNSIRYTTNFTPPSRLNPPANDANTVRLFLMNEGVGTTITDSSTNAQNATLSDGTWNNTPDMETDSPGARVFNWGHVIGNDAADEGIEQRIDGATAGADYVLRALAYGKFLGQPKVTVWDNTNDAEITTIKGDWSRERVANGDFASDTLWTKGTGWSIAAGVASCDGSQTAVSDLLQVLSDQLNGGIVIGKLYKATYTLSGYSAGTVTRIVGGVSGVSRSADGTYTEYFIGGGSGNLYIEADADFIGSIDDVSVTPVSEEGKPDVLICSFELPTIARAGSAADCTSFSIKLLNENSEGGVGWHQCELLPNLLDNPSFEYGAVADPWIPDGWTNGGAVGSLAAGESVQEASIVYSSGKSLEYAASVDFLYGIKQNTSTAVGKFISLGAAIYNALYITGNNNNQIVFQTQLSNMLYEVGVANRWNFAKKVGRVVIPYVSFVGNSLLGYFDDAYAFALDDVSLTATPASLANSQESGGIRVDGYDKLTQPVTKLKATSGSIKFKWTPRHSAADFLKFGQTELDIFRLYGNANNRIIL
ncbi:hypothetical protein IH575_03965, partial [Candidatus Dojkabacteria bacterium]|nr:hypothetical protein [Candidatus Dojkabacteria bacterium]